MSDKKKTAISVDSPSNKGSASIVSLVIEQKSIAENIDFFLLFS